MMKPNEGDVREVVRQKYGKAALTVLKQQGRASCCSGKCGGKDAVDPVSVALYDDDQAAEVPKEALLASLGCGNPTALVELKPGETVLDLGSGGGIDVLLSAKRVGPTGFAYGLDMTDEMLQLAEKNKAKAGLENVRFLKGHIEAIPLPDDSVDVVISNCVINLSGDKPTVLREAFRVLKPGGRFAVSDVVLEGELPEGVRTDMEAYAGCIAGALEMSQYRQYLADAGFEGVGFEVTRRYTFNDLEAHAVAAPTVEKLSEAEKQRLDGLVASAFIRATKPEAR